MKRDPNDPAVKRALEVIVETLRDLPMAEQQEGLTGIAVIAICAIRGTYGQQFARDFLRGASKEVESPRGLQIQLDARDTEKMQ